MTQLKSHHVEEIKKQWNQLRNQNFNHAYQIKEAENITMVNLLQTHI